MRRQKACNPTKLRTGSPLRLQDKEPQRMISQKPAPDLGIPGCEPVFLKKQCARRVDISHYSLTRGLCIDETLKGLGRVARDRDSVVFARFACTPAKLGSDVN